MHLTDEQIERLADGQAAEPVRLTLEQHLASCAGCGGRVAAARQQAVEVTARLWLVDHPVPPVSVETVIRLARKSQAGPGRWAAAILLSVGLAGAAYATPGSPLPGWVEAVAGWIRSEPRDSKDLPLPPPAPVPLPAGIAVVPGEDLIILFQPGVAAGGARAVLTDGKEVVVRTINGDAGFTAGAGRLVIAVRSDTTSFEVQIPRAAPRIEILIDGHRVLLKVRDRITTDIVPAHDGSYRLSFNR